MLPFISCVFLFGLSLLCTLFQRIRILTSFDSFFELHQQRCAPGLKCFRRDGDQADISVPGCEGEGQARSGDDFCFDHTLSEQPTESPSQTPTPKVCFLFIYANS